MYVTVIHRITDAGEFSRAATNAIEATPSDLRLPLFLNATDDSHSGLCLWEAPSAERVKDFLEPFIGHCSQNEYLPVEIAFMDSEALRKAIPV